MSSQLPLIAGQHGGKRIRIVPAYEQEYKKLLTAARNGNYWANATVLGLKVLTSGRLGKNNIFVRPNNAIAHGAEEFLVVLPGCTAEIERLPNDEYKVLSLRVDTNYFDMKAEGQRPALYRAESEAGAWSTDIINNGKVEKKEHRVVAIADANYSNSVAAAEQVAPRVSSAPGSTSGNTFNSQGFDMHFTPGNSSLGGLINYKNAVSPINNTDINTSAILLAKTMFHAKNTVGISWVSELGGSAVLTQAMQILVDQGVTLPKHTAFMFRPNTSPNVAVKLAHQLKLNLDRNFTKTHALDVIGNSSQLSMIYNRAKNEKNYTVKNASWDVIGQGANVHGAAMLGASIAVGAAAGMGGVIAAPAMPAIAAFAKIFGTGVGLLKVGDSLAEATLPRLHQKVTSKFK